VSAELDRVDAIRKVKLTSFCYYTMPGQCCRLHVVGQRVVSDISIDCCQRRIVVASVELIVQTTQHNVSPTRTRV